MHSDLLQGFWSITQEPNFGKNAVFAKSTKKQTLALYAEVRKHI